MLVPRVSTIYNDSNITCIDVKPSNILLDRGGCVKLCDFGISGRLVDSKAKTRSAGCAAYLSVSTWSATQIQISACTYMVCYADSDIRLYIHGLLRRFRYPPVHGLCYADSDIRLYIHGLLRRFRYPLVHTWSATQIQISACTYIVCYADSDIRLYMVSATQIQISACTYMVCYADSDIRLYIHGLLRRFRYPPVHTWSATQIQISACTYIVCYPDSDIRLTKFFILTIPPVIWTNFFSFLYFISLTLKYHNWSTLKMKEKSCFSIFRLSRLCSRLIPLLV